jgi:hypothetical protein
MSGAVILFGRELMAQNIDGNEPNPIRYGGALSPIKRIDVEGIFISSMPLRVRVCPG